MNIWHKYGSYVGLGEPGYINTIICLKNKEHKEFLKLYGASIDGFKLNGFNYDDSRSFYTYDKISVVFEVKTRWENTKSKRYDLSKSSYNSYVKSMEMGIPTKLIEVIFYDNYNIEISERDFEKKYFKIRDKGKYNNKKDQPISSLLIKDGEHGLFPQCPTCGQYISKLIK